MHGISVESLQRTTGVLERLCRLWSRVTIRRRERSLRLCETLSLGEKRMVAVVQFERERYLLGVTNQAICLLQGPGEAARPAGAGRELPGENL
jgi:flagellar biogenesis protein FliO